MSEFNTRPTIETVYDALLSGFKNINARLDALDARLDRLEGEMQGLHVQIDDLTRNNRRLEDKVNVFIEEVIALSRELHRQS
jgi:uncharacterized protein YoxC